MHSVHTMAVCTTDVLHISLRMALAVRCTASALMTTAWGDCRSSWLAGQKLLKLPRPLQRAGRALNLGAEPQRYYPQCGKCSQRQAAAVRANRRTLVLHFGGIRPWFFAGPHPYH